MIFALLSRRLRAFVIGAVLVRLAPVVARLLHAAADGLRRRGKHGAPAAMLTKAGDALLWVGRRRGRGRDTVG
ncbi:MAG: hypothetical protein H0V64_14850 [Geodermatophilaceae bacterium]|jgi:hypothetical protein|nr:hypothetical protein [Geodermatophilaceae bacterium]MDQ3466169.1 hypothetical protein [Actinomycetota bacterium]